MAVHLDYTLKKMIPAMEMFLINIQYLFMSCNWPVSMMASSPSSSSSSSTFLVSLQCGSKPKAKPNKEKKK